MHVTLGVRAWQCACVSSQTMQHALSGIPGPRLPASWVTRPHCTIFIEIWGGGSLGSRTYQQLPRQQLLRAAQLLRSLQLLRFGERDGILATLKSFFQ